MCGVVWCGLLKEFECFSCVFFFHLAGNFSWTIELIWQSMTNSVQPHHSTSMGLFSRPNKRKGMESCELALHHHWCTMETPFRRKIRKRRVWIRKFCRNITQKLDFKSVRSGKAVSCFSFKISLFADKPRINRFNNSRMRKSTLKLKLQPWWCSKHYDSSIRNSLCGLVVIKFYFDRIIKKFYETGSVIDVVIKNLWAIDF